MLFISCHFLKDSLPDHVSFSVALWSQTLFCLRTFTGADAATSNSSYPSFPSKPYALFRTQDPWTLPSRPVRCSRSPRHSVSDVFTVCYLIPVHLPLWNVHSTWTRRVNLCLYLPLWVWYVEDSQYISAKQTPPPRSLPWFPQTVSLPSANFSSLSFLSYFVYEFLKSRIFIHRGKCIKYVYSLTNNYKANTNLSTTQVKI